MWDGLAGWMQALAPPAESGVGLLKHRDALAWTTRALQPDEVQPAQALVTRGHRVRQQILSHPDQPANHDHITDTDELMNAGAGRNNRLVRHSDPTAQFGVIGHDDVIS